MRDFITCDRIHPILWSNCGQYHGGDEQSLKLYATITKLHHSWRLCLRSQASLFFTINTCATSPQDLHTFMCGSWPVSNFLMSSFFCAQPIISIINWNVLFIAFYWVLDGFGIFNQFSGLQCIWLISQDISTDMLTRAAGVCRGPWVEPSLRPSFSLVLSRL